MAANFRIASLPVEIEDHIINELEPLAAITLRQVNANAPEGFCIETLVVDPASEHRLCKKTLTTRALLSNSIVD